MAKDLDVPMILECYLVLLFFRRHFLFPSYSYLISFFPFFNLQIVIFCIDNLLTGVSVVAGPAPPHAPTSPVTVLKNVTHVLCLRLGYIILCYLFILILLLCCWVSNFLFPLHLYCSRLLQLEWWWNPRTGLLLNQCRSWR